MALTMDPEPPLEPPEGKVFAHCAGCGTEIWEGDDCLELWGSFLHDDWECAYKWVLAEAGWRVAGD